jgi:hypothetical protein
VRTRDFSRVDEEVLRGKVGIGKEQVAELDWIGNMVTLFSEI